MRETVALQSAQIRYRGPDDSGYLTDRDFGFSTRRLSIIDNASGHRPIETPDGRFAVVLNS